MNTISQVRQKSITQKSFYPQRVTQLSAPKSPPPPPPPLFKQQTIQQPKKRFRAMMCGPRSRTWA